MESKHLVITNPEEFEEKKIIFKQEGNEKIHIVSDFDRTLTNAFVHGEKMPSVIAQLRNGEYISKDYAEKSHELFDKYHPIEVDPNISLEEKKKKMEEWWRLHKLLMIKSGLNLRDIEDVVKNGPLEFRTGAEEFFELTKEKDIPLVVFSASGIGEAVRLYFKKINKNYKNIHTITNSLEFDKEGKAIGIIEPLIHVFNKGEIALRGLPIMNELEDKKNVILLGDSLGDIGMIEGFEYNNIIKIGFLNYEDEENLEDFKNAFDIVITGDSDMNFVNKLMKEILK